MSIFNFFMLEYVNLGVETCGSEMARIGAERLESNLLKDDLVANPFRDVIVELLGDNKTLIISVRHVWPDLSVFALFMLAGVLIFLGLSWWLLFPLILLSTRFFRSKYFMYLMLLRNYRKIGYQGKLKLLNTNQIIRRLI